MKKGSQNLIACLILAAVILATGGVWKFLQPGESRNLAAVTRAPDFDLPLLSNLGEYEVPNEKIAIDKLFKLFSRHMERNYSAESVHAYRAVHAKGHGCVQATFKVLDSIDPSLKAGIFAQAGEYASIIRFSNGDGPPENDSKLESRGMAIKLLQISGEKIMNDPASFSVQDFLMADQPAFFVKDVVDYAEVIRAREGSLLAKGEFILKFFKQLRYRDSATPVYDPLSAQYWSKTPYQLGSEVIKFTARPCLASPPQNPPAHQKNYLQEAMKEHLDRENVCFAFYLQKRMNGPERDSKMPIEDASVIWDEHISPFVKVAEISIPKGQDFLSAHEQETCENLSYNPWHALSSQRPLGSLNRVRKIVYEVSSGFRHQHNHP